MKPYTRGLWELGHKFLELLLLVKWDAAQEVALGFTCPTIRSPPPQTFALRDAKKMHHRRCARVYVCCKILVKHVTHEIIRFDTVSKLIKLFGPFRTSGFGLSF